MTRVGTPAAQVLAGLAIRVDALRRETAMVIAADVPAGPAATDGAPRARPPPSRMRSVVPPFMPRRGSPLYR